MTWQNDLYDESEILNMIREGSEQAFEEVYDRYAHRLSVKLIQILKSEELAKDILQDIFIKVWEIREQINPDLPLSGFLYKIATNMSYNVYNRALKEQLILKEAFMGEAADSLDAHIHNKELGGLLEQALATLTPRQREVYTLHKIEGLSYKEISEQLHISTSAINHHIQDAGKQLRIYLKPYLSLILLMLAASV